MPEHVRYSTEMWKQTRPPHASFFANDAMMASSRRVVSFDVSRCSSQRSIYAGPV